MKLEIQQAEITTENFSNFKPAKNLRPLWQKLLFYSAIFLIFAFIIYAGFNLLNKKETSKTKQDIQGKKATSSAKLTGNRCGNKQEYISQYQGYSVCFPSNWIKKQLKPSDLLVGFDPSKIEGEYPGLVSISISDQSENIRIAEITDNSSKFEYDRTSVNATKGTRILWDRTSKDPLANFKKAVDVVVPKFSRTYTISLVSTEKDYQANLSQFDEFLENFKFSDKEPFLPWSDSRNILVYSPWPNDTITNPIEISGEAIAFEGIVNIRIRDDKNHILKETTVQTKSFVERSIFKGSISFNKPSSKKGFVEIFTLSPKDESEQDKVSIPITFSE